MNKKRGITPVLNVGASSLLIIFIILCLAVFAALSVSTAKSDLHFSRKQADRISMYYEANNKAEHIIADIDKMINEVQSDELEGKIEGYMNENGIESTATENGDVLEVYFSVEMSESQALNVGLRIPDNGQGYSISSWELVSTDEWESHENTGFIQLQ